MSGFIQLHRQILEWEWYDDIPTKVLFMHCLLKANYKAKTWRGIEIQRGSFITGLDTLERETGLSKQQIRTSFGKLISTGELTRKVTNKYSLVSIAGYESYQSDNRQATGQATDNLTIKQQTSNKQVTATNNLNNINNLNKGSKVNPLEEEFNFIWTEYKPYEMTRGNKKTALQKYNLARKKTDYETIRNGVARYIEYCHATQCKTKHLTTWINQNGWDDEYIIPNSPNKKTSYLDSLAIASRAVQDDMEESFNEW